MLFEREESHENANFVIEQNDSLKCEWSDDCKDCLLLFVCNQRFCRSPKHTAKDRSNRYQFRVVDEFLFYSVHHITWLTILAYVLSKKNLAKSRWPSNKHIFMRVDDDNSMHIIHLDFISSSEVLVNK